MSGGTVLDGRASRVPLAKSWAATAALTAILLASATIGVVRDVAATKVALPVLWAIAFAAISGARYERRRRR